MRRKTLAVHHPKRRAAVYTLTLLALLAYALPQLPALRHGLAGTFSFLWILFAGLAVAANLYFLFGADRERSRNLDLRKTQSGQTAPASKSPEHRRSY